MIINVRALANRAIQGINPDVEAELWKNVDATTAPSGKRTPVYRKLPIILQLQSMDADDLKQMDSLNIQGVHRKIYAQTQVAAIIRVAHKGGDLVVFRKGVVPEGTTWLATHVLERWPSWCMVAITLQADDLEAFAC